MSVGDERVYSSNIQKGGALLDDCRRVIELWNIEQSTAENLARISENNLLGKASRVRTDDVLRRIIGPRLVAPGPHVLPALKGLLDDPRALREACYYETSRDDQLLAAFAEGPLWTWWQDGRVGVAIADVNRWLLQLATDQVIPEWSDSVRTKVARGLLAALRDFGVLHGGSRKDFAPPSITPRGFAYVAWREHEQGASSRLIVDGPVWRRWLLDGNQVLDMFGQTAKLGVLRLLRAGSAVRIDWSASSLDEVTHAAA